MIHYITTNGIGNPWVAAELRVLDRSYSVRCVLHSMRAPSNPFFKSAWAQEMNAHTRLLYPLPTLGFALSLLAAPFLFRARLLAAAWNAATGHRENLRARVAAAAHLLVACHWARGLRGAPPQRIHSQWAHSCATIGMYAAWLLGVPFSFTGHAVDLFRDRVALQDKVRRADLIICISRFHRDLYRKLGAPDSKLHIVYCGIDVDQFPYSPPRPAPAPRILSLGRLVQKKGFGPLIDACGVLRDRGVPFHCVIAGDGPLYQTLTAQVRRLDLGSRVDVTGKPVLQESLAEFFADGDVFAQPCVWSDDGDVDGTPRTLMEAMASGLPSVSTRLAGIPDIIEHEQSGLLVDPEDVAQLADALQRIIQDAGLARKLSEGGRRRMEQCFEITRCLEPLALLFGAKGPAAAPAPAAESLAQ